MEHDTDPKSVTYHRNVEVLISAVVDVQEFFGHEKVETGRVWERYNVRAEYSDARTLDHGEFMSLVDHAHDRKRVNAGVFGITLP